MFKRHTQRWESDADSSLSSAHKAPGHSELPPFWCQQPAKFSASEKRLLSLSGLSLGFTAGSPGPGMQWALTNGHMLLLLPGQQNTTELKVDFGAELNGVVF